LKINETNETGLALCGFYEEGWGSLVRQGRSKNQYSDDLVTASAEIIKEYWESIHIAPQLVVPVPSLRRPKLVPDFAKKLAQALNLPYQEALAHIEEHAPQSEMRNSFQQAMNIVDNFEVVTKLKAESILLVDDIADSKWTLTILGKLLQEHGSGAIYPFVLAVTNT
jgi:ATP-dependent DNA helicase RecQ